MKRMTENAISYYTVTPDDIKNITPVAGSVTEMFTYTPSQKFLKVIRDFKSALIIDWYEVEESISHIIGAQVSIIYPIGRPFITDEGNLGYAYSGGQMVKPVNPVFFELDGQYYINWKLN